MKLISAATATLKSKRFWMWQIGGSTIYAMPALIRFLTGNVYIPILSLPGFWIDHYIPGNLVEKILVNAFFPGGAGSIAGEELGRNYYGKFTRGKTKYLSRLTGALLQTAAWSLFQYWGYSLMIMGPWSVGSGWGNIFEHWYVFPFNFILACFSIFTPDVLYFVKRKLTSLCQK